MLNSRPSVYSHKQKVAPITRSVLMRLVFLCLCLGHGNQLPYNLLLTGRKWTLSNCHIDLELFLHLDLQQLTVTVGWPRLWFSFQLSYLRLVRPKRAHVRLKAKAKAKANLRLALMKYRQQPDKNPSLTPSSTSDLIPDRAQLCQLATHSSANEFQTKKWKTKKYTNFWPGQTVG